MIKLVLSLALLSLTGPSFAQEKGIKFEQSLTWIQVKEKAKKQNKYIFMDVFATWCGPCKSMDKDVYSSEKLATFMDDKFISVKVQGDRTNSDNQMVKNWYKTSHEIIGTYKVNTYPTLFFFSPNGTLVHRASGFIDAEEMRRLATAALDTNKQYYHRLKKYQKGKMDPSEIKELALSARELGDHVTSQKLADDFINRHLLNDEQKDLYTKQNLEFILGFISNDDSKAFKFLTNESNKVNKILGKYQAEYAIMDYIDRKKLPPLSSWKSIKPNWDSLALVIRKTYGPIGSEIVLAKRMLYYRVIEDWENYGVYYEKYLTLALEHPIYNINDCSWKVFEHVNDPKILTFACDTVMKYAIPQWYQNDSAAFDTYANLLYKTGKKDLAIEWEERAVRLSNHDPELVSTLAKMKKGEATWVK